MLLAITTYVNVARGLSVCHTHAIGQKKMPFGRHTLSGKRLESNSSL